MNDASGPNPPSCIAVRTSSAIGQPSASRPALRRAMPIARYVVPMKSSSRVHSRWIGVPRLRVRDHDGVLGLGPVAVAAEPAAQVAQVQIDVLLGDAGDLRGAEARFLRALIANPDVDAIVR